MLASFPGLPTVQFLVTCSMQKQRGRPGIIYHMNDVNVYLGRQREEGPLIERTHFTDAFFALNQEQYAFHLANVQIRPPARFFDGGSLPPPVYLGRH